MGVEPLTIVKQQQTTADFEPVKIKIENHHNTTMADIQTLMDMGFDRERV